MIYSSTKTRFLLAAYILTLVIAFSLTYYSNRIYVTGFSFYNIGQILAVIGITCLSLQFVLTTRIPILEKGVGLDKIMLLHKTNAKLAFALLILHPIFIFTPQILRGRTLWQLWGSLSLYHYLGEIALTLLIIQVLLSIYFNKIKIKYEHWRLIHKIAYIIIALGFIHSLNLGSNLLARDAVFYWWCFLIVIVVLAIIYRYIVRPIRLRNNVFKIVEIIPESPTANSIYFQPEKGRPFTYAPGQFAFIHFTASKLPTEEHHFTLSSAPNQDRLSFTIKQLGDFTSETPKLQIGDKAIIEGPFGSFSNQGLPGPFIFIAGGIGITPLMSMIRHQVNQKQSTPITLLYANRTLNDVAFKNELDQVAQNNPWFKVIHILSDEETPPYYYGRLNDEIIQKEVTNISSHYYFIVGPPPMMKATTEMLIKMGVEKNNIFTEKFSLV